MHSHTEVNTVPTKKRGFNKREEEWKGVCNKGWKCPKLNMHMVLNVKDFLKHLGINLKEVKKYTRKTSKCWRRNWRGHWKVEKHLMLRDRRISTVNMASLPKAMQVQCNSIKIQYPSLQKYRIILEFSCWELENQSSPEMSKPIGYPIPHGQSWKHI